MMAMLTYTSNLAVRDAAPAKNSGAMKSSVISPMAGVRPWMSTSVEPKSPTLTCFSLVRNTFRLLRSLCTRLRDERKANALAS